MLNVIYTGVFSIGWDYFNGLNPWQIYNLYHMQKYCEKHNIELRIIDNSNSIINKLFEYAKRESNSKADSWNIATLCSIVALEDFVRRKDGGNFFWLDADICITDINYNIFNLITKDAIYIETSNYRVNEKKDLFYSYFSKKYPIIYVNNDTACYSGIFGMNDIRAKRTVEFLHDYDIDICNFSPFVDSMIKLYKDSRHFISDECIFQVLVNSYLRHNTCNIGDLLKIKVITHDSDRNFDEDVFCYHFASETKYLIPEFWKHRNNNAKFSS